MIAFLAKSYTELEDITEQIKAIGGVKSFEVKSCFDKQREGLNSTFMFGVQEFKRVTNFLHLVRQCICHSKLRN